MPATRIEIRTADGVAPAFEFGAPSAPKVLMLIDGLGMRPAMHEIAERIAAAGYRVLMPDVFYRMGEYTSPDPTKLFTDPEVRAAWWGKTQSLHTPAKMMADIGSYLDHFGAEKCGTTGYCMGGRLSITAATVYGDRIAAAAAYHPGGLVTDAPDSPHLAFGNIKAKVYIAGAIEDTSFTDAQRKTCEDALTAAGVDHQVELYQAKHGWVPTDMPVHDKAAAERHWETLLALFKSTLR